MSYFAQVKIEGEAGHIAKVVETGQIEVVSLDYAHYEIHEGNHYFVKKTASLAKAGTKDILIVTPDQDIYAHLIAGVEATSSSFLASFFEDVTATANGTLGGSRNRNRNAAENNTTIVYEDPTITATGNLLWSLSLGAGRNVGGASRDNEEVILKKNTKYLLRITEDNVAATNINWNLDWYEHAF